MLGVGCWVMVLGAGCWVFECLGGRVCGCFVVWVLRIGSRFDAIASLASLSSSVEDVLREGVGSSGLRVLGVRP